MISVVVPLFNKEPHISKTLDSVLAQTLLPAHVIVVDDGSKDGSASVVAKYLDRGVQLIQQPNQGESAARNTGIAACQTTYIAFLDADDWWLPNHLEELQGLIERHPDASMLSTSHLIRREGKTYRARSSLPEGWRGKVPNFFEQYAKGLSLINSSTACVRKTALLDVGGFPVGVRRGPDVMTWINIGLKHAVAHANVPTAIFNQEAVNRSDQHHETEPPGSLLLMQQLLGEGLVPKHQRPSLGLLFDSMSLMTAAGFGLKGDTQAAQAIARLAYKAGRYKVATMIALVNALPAGVLRLARRWRHRSA